MPPRLVRQSTAHTRHVYAYTFPQDHWKMRWSIRFFGPVAGLFLPFRVRFSKPEAIWAWAREAGFERVSRNKVELWHTEVLSWYWLLLCRSMGR